MGILEAVKKGFQGANKLMNVVGIFFAFNVVVGLISLPLANPERAADPGIIAISVLSSIIFFLIFAFLQGGALGLAKDHVKTNSFDMSKFTEYGKKFYTRIILLLLLYLAVAIVTVLVYGLVSTGLLLVADNAFTRGLVALLVVAGTVAIVTFLIYPIYVLVAEDKSVMESFKKGLQIAKGNFLSTLGLFVVLLLASLVISVVIGFVAGIVSVPLPLALGQILITVVNAAVQSYIPLVMIVAFMGFYMALTATGAESQERPGLSTEGPTGPFNE